jgi:hypothetical protein
MAVFVTQQKPLLFTEQSFMFHYNLAPLISHSGSSSSSLALDVHEHRDGY